MKKILIVVSPQIGGVEYHRQLIPHYCLNEHEEWEVSQINEIDTATDEFLKQFQIIHFARMASAKGQHMDVLRRIRNLGIKSVVDLDDFWILPAKHPLRYAWERNKIAQQIVDTLSWADYVTTTTESLATMISKVNANVLVLPNAINSDQPQYEAKPTRMDKLRFGWVGGYSHLEDISLMGDSLKMLNTSPFTEGKYQLYLMGFDPKDRSNAYTRYEKIFVNGLNINSDIYYRIPGVDVYNYAQGYNLFDVALAPLANNRYNNCKSELKVIEAGFMRKAIIASNVTPYAEILDETNSLTVDAGYNHKHWYNHMNTLIKNPEMVSDLADALYEAVKVKYHINTVNEIRMQLYNHLINN